MLFVKYFSTFGKYLKSIHKIFQYLWILPVVKVVVILILCNRLQFLLIESCAIFVHFVSLPFSRVLVAVWYKTAVVPVLEEGL